MSVERIKDGIVVTIAYAMTVDGETLETATPDEPLVYLHGADNIVPGLEEALYGKETGDNVSVSLSPEKGYGPYEQDALEEVPIGDLDMSEQPLEPGMLLEIEDEDGDYFEAMVREVKSDTVVLDFNSPLAGKTIHFDVEVLGLRAASDEELEYGIPIEDEDGDDFD